MSDIKKVKVDNWGIYFLQRLKHFFNRTDYCDLTLQFQDNAQLKVHRLVLSACTEYFELLERTCEMYEDCLVMPDDLQAEVVVPIVNFMYTGHLEFRMDLLERLYQTSQILNMPVLTKLLESHRNPPKAPAHSYAGIKKFTKTAEINKVIKPNTSTKRSYSKAFENNHTVYRDKKVYQPLKTSETVNTPSTYRPPSPLAMDPIVHNRKVILGDPRPTRYELPEELDNDNVFDNSFCNISYTCKPLMIHPETVKRYSSKRSGIFNEASSSKKLLPGMSTVDIVECKRISKDENIFDDSVPDHMNDDMDIFHPSYNETAKDCSQLFDQILDDGPKVTIETKDSKIASNLDHAKIISEVLKKYPHLVKSNKNIKLKILNTPSKGKKQQKSPSYVEEKPMKLKTEEPDYTYETDVIDSQQAAKLIALGAENIKGPWICLICGTPGKALHFTSYYKFRRHLVEVHNEKPVSNICEYCGLRSLKRNYLLHHLYSQHNVPPPPQYHFPKCNRCNYIALTEGLLVKHKMTHNESKNFRCNVCSAPFNTTKELLQHIQATGHKYSAEKKTNLQCIYCLKTFLRHGNLYAHLKTHHKKEAKNDGVIDDSDDEKHTPEIPQSKVDNRETKYHHIKFEPSTSYDIYNEHIYEEVDVQYEMQERPDGDIQLTPRKQHVITNRQHNSISNTPKQKILNTGFGSPKPATQKPKPIRRPQPERNTFLEDINIPSPPPTANNINEDEIVLIDDTEYIMRDNQLIPKKPKIGSSEYIITDMMEPASLQPVQPAPSMEYTNIHNSNIVQDAQTNMVVKKTSNINQPIQIVVSNEEEYKALMASNHPILFDNGDPNKTLTVLTAPHNATIESTGIDLDTTQTNDMMIIQEEFPLNVTEAVSTDNSNIVVVYSHPVDDQNKQFQILTTGGIGSQFVQSSAIITQNYETVTTSTAAMSAHVLEPQNDTAWRENVQTTSSEQLPTSSQSELQNVVENVEIKDLENETSNGISDLPEVHLGPELQTVIPQESLAISDNTANELNVINNECLSEAVQPEVPEESHNVTETQIETEMLGDSIVEQEPTPVSEPVEMPQDSEDIPEVLANEENTEIVEQNPIQTDGIEDQQQTVAESAEIIPMVQPVIDTNVTIAESVDSATDDLKHTLEDSQPLPSSQAYDDIVEINHNKVTTPEVNIKGDEKIQNLTSEWSEEECDSVGDIPATAPIVSSTAAAVIGIQQPDLLEETIENIQQEVLNHVTSAAALAASIQPLPEIETEESESSALEDTIPSPQEPQLLPAPAEVVMDPIQNDPQTQEKISSLLNDWEDNDSQEENNTEVPEEGNKEVVPDTVVDNNIPKADNIKSLVSDWDDDDEEMKEQ